MGDKSGGSVSGSERGDPKGISEEESAARADLKKRLRGITDRELEFEVRRRREACTLRAGTARAIREIESLDLEGPWLVTTEGDCEGRTTKVLSKGTWGSFGDVAFQYARHGGYVTTIEPLKIQRFQEAPMGGAEPKHTSVRIGGISMPWDNDASVLAVYRRLLGDRFTVTIGPYYRSVRIERKKE